jgi:hypothetical protein
MGERPGSYKVFFGGRSEGRTTLGRLKSGWDDCIKMHLQEVGWGNVKWVDLAQNRDSWWGLVNAVTNKGVQYNTIS